MTRIFYQAEKLPAFLEHPKPSCRSHPRNGVAEAEACGRRNTAASTCYFGDVLNNLAKHWDGCNTHESINGAIFVGL